MLFVPAVLNYLVLFDIAPALTLGSNFELRPKQSNTDYQKLAQGYIHTHTPHSGDHSDVSVMTSTDRKEEPPRVLECGPIEGPPGTTVRVVLQTFPTNPALKLAFGGLVVDTKQLDNANFTTLAAIVPNATHTLNNASQMPISVCVYENDAVHNSWVIGDFTYTEGNVYYSKKYLMTFDRCAKPCFLWEMKCQKKKLISMRKEIFPLPMPATTVLLPTTC
jgi:hypothetical protein